MAPNAQINNYLHNHYEGMDPKHLILALYKGALDRLKLAMEGIEENSIKKRGENLSKLIAIISELNASVDTTMKDESTKFLRGLYDAMLMELPKVSINNDIKILKRTEAYILKLKEIWENDVMAEEKANKLKVVEQKKETVKQTLVAAFKDNSPKTSFSSISV